MIHYLANDDAKDTLSIVKIFRESRKVDFIVDKPADYSLFSHFPEDLLSKLEMENLTLHAHSWVIKTDTYSESKVLNDFFNILAVDEH